MGMPTEVATGVSMEAADYAALLGVPDTHTLRLSRGARTRRRGSACETRWIEERDPAATLIARYRTWVNRSAHPPHRTQFGWERYTPDGTLTDREVRYSSAASVAALH